MHSTLSHHYRPAHLSPQNPTTWHGGLHGLLGVQIGGHSNHHPSFLLSPQAQLHQGMNNLMTAGLSVVPNFGHCPSCCCHPGGLPGPGWSYPGAGSVYQYAPYQPGGVYLPPHNGNSYQNDLNLTSGMINMAHHGHLALEAFHDLNGLHVPKPLHQAGLLGDILGIFDAQENVAQQQAQGEHVAALATTAGAAAGISSILSAGSYGLAKLTGSSMLQGMGLVAKGMVLRLSGIGGVLEGGHDIYKGFTAEPRDWGRMGVGALKTIGGAVMMAVPGVGTLIGGAITGAAYAIQYRKEIGQLAGRGVRRISRVGRGIAHGLANGVANVRERVGDFMSNFLPSPPPHSSFSPFGPAFSSA